MVSFIITGLNDIGEAAIKQHLEEKKLLSKKDRITYKMTFEEKIINSKPFALSIRKRKVAQALSNDDLLTIFNNAMVKNGAKKQDYNIRVVN